MDFKQRMLKLNWKNGKDKWLILLAVGLILLILSFPTEDSGGGFLGGVLKSSSDKTSASLTKLADTEEEAAMASGGGSQTYEQQMEARVKEILSHVEGVGAVEVMIVLKSSEERVLRVDKDTSTSLTKETDSSGGSRHMESYEISEDTIMSGGGESGAPFVEKELKPQIAGVVISAQGGGSQKIKAEISEAMEALFDIPPHKVKVLKRVE